MIGKEVSREPLVWAHPTGSQRGADSALRCRKQKPPTRTGRRQRMVHAERLGRFVDCDCGTDRRRRPEDAEAKISRGRHEPDGQGRAKNELREGGSSDVLPRWWVRTRRPNLVRAPDAVACGHARPNHVPKQREPFPKKKGAETRHTGPPEYQSDGAGTSTCAGRRRTSQPAHGEGIRGPSLKAGRGRSTRRQRGVRVMDRGRTTSEIEVADKREEEPVNRHRARKRSRQRASSSPGTEQRQIRNPASGTYCRPRCRRRDLGQ